MTVSIDRLVFGPGIAVVGATVLIPGALNEAVAMLGLEAIAEQEGTPLSEITIRAALRPHGGNGDDIAEFAGRFCYSSWSKGRGHEDYCENIIDQGHGSVYAHADVLFAINGISRSLSLELIRHHIGTNYSQESQRFVPAHELRFIVPPLMVNEYRRQFGNAPLTEETLGKIPGMTTWRRAMQGVLYAYEELVPELTEMAREAEVALELGDIKAATSARKRALEASRSVLPNAAETKMTFKCNLREMRWILNQRGSEFADLEIRRFAVNLYEATRLYAPEFFKLISVETGSDGLPTLNVGKGHI